VIIPSQQYTGGHPSQEAIEDYVMDVPCDPQTLSTMEEHFLLCEACCQRWADAEESMADICQAALKYYTKESGRLPN
jgi:hypothetical protein